MSEQTSPIDSASVTVPFPPPIAFIAGLVIGFGLHIFFPLRIVRSLAAEDILQIAGIVLLSASAVLVVSAALCFRGARTSPGFEKPSASLITAGPFRLCRNPLYLAGALVHCGLPLLANALLPLLLLPPAFVVVDMLVRREEKYLIRRFGAEYEAYCRRVRRWI